MKGNFHEAVIQELLPKESIEKKHQWSINTDYHFGAYAKHTQELIDFINDFSKEYDIQLEPIYTAKMLFGIFDLVRKNYFTEGSVLLAVHTGGLQGIEGFNERFGPLIKTKKD